MAAIVLGPALGGLVGAAVYYTVSQTITNRTDYLRSELHTLSLHLTASSLPPTSTPLPAFNSPTPVRQESLTDLVKARWNQSLSSFVRKLETTELETLGRQSIALGSAAYHTVSNTIAAELSKAEHKVEKKLVDARDSMQSTEHKEGDDVKTNKTVKPGGVLADSVGTGIGMSPGGSESSVADRVSSKRLV